MIPIIGPLLLFVGLASAPPSCETDTECFELCLSQGQLDCDAEYFGTLEEDE